MEADLSRGHRPDAKRGRAYRRVLVRQGAALLDSDIAALGDAQDRLLREAVGFAACAQGSPDLGFCVTPGVLLAQFLPGQGPEPVVTAPATAARDFSRRYLDRLPGLRLAGPGGTVQVPLAVTLPAATPVRLWLRADLGATITVNGTAVAVPAAPAFAAFDLVVGGGTLTIAPDPANPCWLAMVETRANSAGTAVLHWAAGRYQIGGLIAQTPALAWPALANPAGAALVAASNAAAGARLVTYLELAERHVTAVEDPGLVEQALGGDGATTSRTVLAAQVKVAAVAAGLTPQAVAAAIRAPALPGGTVLFGTAAAVLAADPCDLPVPGGYTGPDNRLYRLAVHDVSGGRTLFKWSRDNAADLVAATLPPAPATTLRVAAEAPLRAGDLVEVLSDATDHGDAAPGAVTAAGFARPRRPQGRLVRLDGGGTVTGTTRVFDLLDPETEGPAAPLDLAALGAAGVKLRRWDGLIARPGAGALTVAIEHGIEAQIDGAFEPGDWWQYEARVLAPNANGPAVPQPHGPERLFAPLALLEQTPAGQPMRLLAWLDTRHDSLCAPQADGAAYDGTRVGTPADTVQEALDELFLRLGDGCGEIAVPPGADLQGIFDAMPAGFSAKVCLNAGTRDLPARVLVAGKGDLVIGGIGGGTLLRRTGRPVFEFRNCRSVTLRDFAVETTGGSGPVLMFTDCGAVSVEGLRVQAATGTAPGAVLRVRRTGPQPQGRVRLTGNRLTVGRGDGGIEVIGAEDVAITDNALDVPATRFDIRAAMGDALVAAAVGNVLFDRLDFHADDEFDFVGSPVFEIPPGGPATRRRRGVVMANGMWGRSVLTFTTHGRLSADDWDALARANQPPGGRTTNAIGMRRHLRGLRVRLARAMMNPAGRDAVVPATVRADLDLLAADIIRSNAVQAGGAGIVVVQRGGPFRSRNPARTADTLVAEGGARVRVSDNAVEGFVQGIRLAATGADDRWHFMGEASVTGNRIALRLPMQAYQRGGVLLGNALLAQVEDNAVLNPAWRPTASLGGHLIDADGIRLWGAYGPMLRVRGNTVQGLTVGVRLAALNQAGQGAVRVLADNATVGALDPQIVQ